MVGPNGGMGLTAGLNALLNQSNPNSISPDANFRAEYKLLTDFLVSVPRIKQEKVGQFIKNAEHPAPIESLQRFIENHGNAMPKISGMKGYALSSVLRDMPDHEFSKRTQHGQVENFAYDGVPEIGVIKSDEISEMNSSLTTSYLTSVDLFLKLMMTLTLMKMTSLMMKFQEIFHKM